MPVDWCRGKELCLPSNRWQPSSRLPALEQDAIPSNRPLVLNNSPTPTLPLFGCLPSSSLTKTRGRSEIRELSLRSLAFAETRMRIANETAELKEYEHDKSRIILKVAPPKLPRVEEQSVKPLHSYILDPI